MIEHSLAAQNQQRSSTGLNLRWLADIICHLRDDLADENSASDLPHNADIFAWVEESYYPGLQQLTWEEAVLSLLNRMQRSCTGHTPPQKVDFASEALAQLRRATRHSLIWNV